MECEKVKKQYPAIKYELCCQSCHEDDDTGFGNDLWFEIGGEERHVCCAVSMSFKRWREEVDREYLRKK